MTCNTFVPRKRFDDLMKENNSLTEKLEIALVELHEALELRGDVCIEEDDYYPVTQGISMPASILIGVTCAVFGSLLTLLAMVIS